MSSKSTSILEMLKAMVQAQASDIHLQVGAPPTMRVYGKLKPFNNKVMSQGDIETFAKALMTPEQQEELEYRKELDFAFTLPGLARFRCNLLHQRGSMGMVIRVVSEAIPGFEALGLPKEVMESLANQERGLVLVTGPTGSGKTTTLYAVLNYINRPDRKIITVEDPVEYIMSGINQVQVNEAVGLTFAAALRAMLRQAPNVIMLGEIRDLETASIAINASLTGHLVFSTLHTNDAPSAVTRLIDIGVKPFLVASSARALMAQRLVRKVCKKCGQPYQPLESELQALSIDAAKAATATFRKGRGCAECNKTGYRGRMGIFEIFVIEDEVRKLIYDKVPATVLRARARELGMRTLREDGTRKVLAGLTTPEEVIRATAMDTD